MNVNSWLTLGLAVPADPTVVVTGAGAEIDVTVDDDTSIQATVDDLTEISATVED